MAKVVDVKIGETFNRWTVLSEVYYKNFPGGSKAKFVDCLCECGTESSLRLSAPTSPTQPSLSCGCLRLESMAKLIKQPTIGEVFGKLTILSEITRKNKRSYVEVVCNCGSPSFTARMDQLKNGNTKSCGCFQKESVIRVNTTHGMTKTTAYSSWQSMKDRCTNPNNVRWDRYGGRGINYPMDWDDFEGFWKDMSEGWYDGADIDRINYNLSYSKENCRWVDRDIGNHNKSKSKGTSKYKGVHFDKSRNYWVARLSRNGIVYLQQRFETEISAAVAYDNCSEEIYGDRPNNTVRGSIP